MRHRICGRSFLPAAEQTGACLKRIRLDLMLTMLGPEGMLRPHRPQNFEFCGSGAEHLGHGNDPGLSPGLTKTKDRPPQRPQNFTPSAKREWHVAHATMPGIMLEWMPPLLLPCDGEGWLAVPRISRSWAWMTCSFAPSRTSMTRSSSRSPGFETRSMC
jgi:hypothetical protein